MTVPAAMILVYPNSLCAKSASTTRPGNNHGQETYFEESAATALATLVRQPRQSGHDRALYRALSQLRADRRGTALGQADHRHRADRLRPVALQPASSAIGRARTRGYPLGRRHRLRIS